MVLAAGDSAAPGAAAALEQLCRTYWHPLYTYVRRQGRPAHDAQDLTQEFFARLLAKDCLRQVQIEKGRFRSFLLAALKHFLANEWDRANAIKRGGRCAFISWDAEEEEAPERMGAPPGWTAERVYERQWALTLLEQVNARLRAECAAAGKREMFEALRPYLSGEQAAPAYAEVGARLKMSAGAVQVAVHRLRRRYGELLRQEIAQTVSSPAEVDEELRHVFSALRG
ncbi:MAG TPA: sigma factor [Candidatus Binatia bacterium]|nr:sigma factor [Candidatus Binatia bacterium]